jgi:hypothetical protein
MRNQHTNTSVRAVIEYQRTSSAGSMPRYHPIISDRGVALSTVRTGLCPELTRYVSANRKQSPRGYDNYASNQTLFSATRGTLFEAYV